MLHLKVQINKFGAEIDLICGNVPSALQLRIANIGSAFYIQRLCRNLSESLQFLCVGCLSQNKAKQKARILRLCNNRKTENET